MLNANQPPLARMLNAGRMEIERFPRCRRLAITNTNSVFMVWFSSSEWLRRAESPSARPSGPVKRKDALRPDFDDDSARCFVGIGLKMGRQFLVI